MNVNLVPSFLFRLLSDGRLRRRNAEAVDRACCGVAAGTSCPVVLWPNELIRLTKRSGFWRIEVRHGLIWLTGAGSGGDVVVRAGERFELADHWPFVLQALSHTEVWLDS